jgi:hypothetical protein
VLRVGHACELGDLVAVDAELENGSNIQKGQRKPSEIADSIRTHKYKAVS